MATPATAGSGPGSPNPADRPAFRRDLLRLVDQLAATVTYPTNADPRPTGHGELEHRQAIAAAWVYLSSVAAWAEDHGLVTPLLRDNPHGVIRGRASSLLWLGRAFQQLTVHPATQWLPHPEYNRMLWAGTPCPGAASDLIDWWATPAPGLAYAPTGGHPASINGWPIVRSLAPVTGGTVYPARQAIGRILTGVDGVDIDPLTAAVARLRLTVYIGHLMARAGLIHNHCTWPASPPPSPHASPSVTPYCWAPASPARNTAGSTRTWSTCPAPRSRELTSTGRPSPT